jgi:hypothetical protein
MFGFHPTAAQIELFLNNTKENFSLIITFHHATFESGLEMKNQTDKPSQPLTSVTPTSIING